MDYKLTLITPVSSFSINNMKTFFSMLKKQTNQNFECVLVLNGKEKIIEKALLSLKSCNIPKNVKIIVDDSDTYIGGARNRGINRSKGIYVSFVDLDDTLNERFIETTYNIIKNNIDAIIYNYSIVSVQKNGKTSVKHKKIIEKEEIISGKKASELCIRKKINKPCWNKVFKKAILENPFFLNCNGEDYCMPLILEKCNHVYLSTYESYNYYSSPISSSHKSDYENCFYSLILSAIVLNNFGLSYLEPIMSLSKEDIYKAKIVFNALNIKSEIKIVDAFYKKNKKCIIGKLNFKSSILHLLSKTTLGSKLIIKIKNEQIFTTRMKSFLALYLNEAISSFEKFK